jgi:predicted PurR-regulated permease PerM
VIKMHELIIVLAVAAGLTIGGVVGAFLAVPIVALIAETARYYRGRNEVLAVPPPDTSEEAVAGASDRDRKPPKEEKPTK